jgi:hypothetical protein
MTERFAAAGAREARGGKLRRMRYVVNGARVLSLILFLLFFVLWVGGFFGLGFHGWWAQGYGDSTQRWTTSVTASRGDVRFMLNRKYWRNRAWTPEHGLKGRFDPADEDRRFRTPAPVLPPNRGSHLVGHFLGRG